MRIFRLLVLDCLGLFQMPFLVDRSVQALETAELVTRLGDEQVLVLAGDFNSPPGKPHSVSWSLLAHFELVTSLREEQVLVLAGDFNSPPGDRKLYHGPY